jgi:hypothetical protein
VVEGGSLVVLVAFGWFVIWGIGSAVLWLIGWCLTSILQGQVAASDLTIAWFFAFDGILAGAAGYGTIFFMCRERSILTSALQNVIDVPDPLRQRFENHLKFFAPWWRTPAVAVLLTVIGGFIANGAGIPLKGFAHAYLSVMVISFYFVGAYGLMFIVGVLNLFRFIDTHSDSASDERIKLKTPFLAQGIQTIDLFLVVSSGMCILAVYVCFRGTLTAFAGAPPAFYKALIIPVFFYLPASLVYSFYPRYVLRQVWENDTFAAIERFAEETRMEVTPDLKERLELRKLILDVKEKMLAERRALPLLSFKDAPTLTMALLIAIQLVAQKDPIVSVFLGLVGK